MGRDRVRGVNLLGNVFEFKFHVQSFRCGCCELFSCAEHRTWRVLVILLQMIWLEYTGKNHQLPAMLVTESVLCLSRQNSSYDLCQILSSCQPHASENESCCMRLTTMAIGANLWIPPMGRGILFSCIICGAY